MGAHLEMNSDKILGPGAGAANIFASRDSYLALNPQHCTFEGHKTDPLQYGLREQMAYQYAESGRDLTLKAFNEKFEDWTRSKLGTNGCHLYYQRAALELFYAVRYERCKGSHALENIRAARQTQHYVCACVESVLDIVNYNTMIVDGLSGKLNSLTSPSRFSYK